MDILVSSRPSSQQSFDIATESFDVIRRVLWDRKRFRLDSYKDNCIRRRIGVRIRASGCESVQDYCTKLVEDPSEVDNLFKVLTVHVSQFYRNPSMFALLKEMILPELFGRAAALDRHLSIWSVGCSSGEEPYTVALILKDSFAGALAETEVSIVGTDVNNEILEKARSGLYGDERLVNIEARLKQRWFSQAGEKYELSPELRAMVLFRTSDLDENNVLFPCDLILCRNVLIYFERAEQERIIKAFADALGKGGMLILGKSETLVGATRAMFETVCPEERIYRVV